MSRPETSPETAAGISRARVLLVVFVALWLALLVGVLRYGPGFSSDTGDDAFEKPVPRVAASGSLPSTAASPARSVATRADVVDDGSGDARDASAAEARPAASRDAEGESLGAGVVDEQVVGGGDDSSGGADEMAAAEGERAAGSAAEEVLGGGEMPGGSVGESGVADGRAEGGGDRDDGVRRAERESAVPVRATEPDTDDAPTPSAEPVESSAAATAAVESAFEVRRRDELVTLARLLESVRFERFGSEPAGSASDPLERAFEILILYPDTRLEIVVHARETGDALSDRRLAGERGKRILEYLVSRGIEPERLAVGTGDGRDLPFGEHRVKVQVEDEDR